MSQGTSSWTVLPLALAALVAAWAWSGPHLLPMYEGIFLPQPYRYLKPPPGATDNIPPRPASSAIHVTPGKQFPLSIVYTPENIPQARLDLLDGAFKIPPGATRAIITIRPVPPPVPLPQGIEAASNVYAFSVRTQSGAILRPVKGKASVDLLAYRRHGTPFIEQYRSGLWRALATGQFVNIAVYSAPVTSLGDFVVVTRGGPTATSSSSNILRTVLIGAAAALLVLAAVILLAVPRLRSRSRA